MDASSTSQEKSTTVARKKYVAPELTDYGTVGQQTQAGSNTPLALGDGATLSS